MRSLLFLTAALALSILPAGANEQLKFDPYVVRLSGLLSLQSFYGPPNYGEDPETDRVEVWPILELNAPIDVSADPAKPDGIDSGSTLNVTRVQLVGSVASKMTDRVGRRITVEGTLSSRVIAHEHTDVIMLVKQVISDRP